MICAVKCEVDVGKNTRGEVRKEKGVGHVEALSLVEVWRTD